MAESVEFAVEVHQGLTSKGRSLFAQRDFKESDVLFTEQPLVSCQFVWNAMYKYVACDHCMKSLETAEEMYQRLSSNKNMELPYPECCEVQKMEHVTCPKCQVLYCSENCRQLALNDYHETLCTGSASRENSEHPLFRLADVWRFAHYPPETCSIMLIARMIAKMRQSKDREALKALYSQFCKATHNEEENIAHKLLGEEFKAQLNLLREILADILYEEELQQWFTPDGFSSLLAMIGTNGQGIGTSSFSVWANNCENLETDDSAHQQLDDLMDKLYDDMGKISGDFLNCEGSGLYVLQSSCNHSCVPNAEVTFPNNNFVLSVKAVKDIKKGEEIFISYLDECDRERSRHSRQQLLQKNYLFKCQCEKCVEQADDPDVTSDEEEELEEEDCDDHCMDHGN